MSGTKINISCCFQRLVTSKQSPKSPEINFKMQKALYMPQSTNISMRQPSLNCLEPTKGSLKQTRYGQSQLHMCYWIQKKNKHNKVKNAPIPHRSIPDY